MSAPHATADSPDTIDNHQSNTTEQLADGERNSHTPEQPPIQQVAAEVGTERLPAPQGGWSLADLQQTAINNHPGIQQATATLNKTYGMHTQVGLKPNPRAGYVGDEMGDSGTAGRQGAFISQTVVTGKKLHWNQKVIEGEMVAVRWLLETEKQRVRNDVQLQYIEVLGLQQKLKLAQELEKIAQSGVTTAQLLFEAKQAARPDILQAKIQLNEVFILKRNTEFEYETACSVLASLIGLPTSDATMLTGRLDQFKVRERELESSFQQIVANSPELQTAYAHTSRASYLIGRQRAQVIPNITTEIRVLHDNVAGDDLASVQMGLPIPIFNRNQGNISLASSEYRKASWNAERLQLALRIRLMKAFRDYQTAKYQVQRYRDDILPSAKENLVLTEAAYKEGELGFIRVLTARRSYFESNMLYFDSLIDLLKSDALIEGMLLTGSLEDLPDNFNGALRGVGLRGQALNGQ